VGLRMNTDYQDMQNSGAEPLKTYPLNPAWLIPITLVAGLAASGPLAGAILFRCGYRKLGWFLGVLLGLLGLLIFGFTILWSVEWYWVALTLTGVHLLSGIALLWIVWRPSRRFWEIHPLPPKHRGTYREVIAGMVGGIFIGGLLGMICTVFYLFLIDWLFSTFMPVMFEDSFTMYRLSTGVLFLAFSGGVAGGFIGRFKPRITAGQIFLYGLGLIWAHYTWLFALEGAIAIPGFQAGAATGGGWEALMLSFSSSNFLIGFWWSVFLLFFIITPPGIFEKLARAVQVIGINLTAAITLSITFGYPADTFLALGQYFEREALTAKALWCYEHGLKKEPGDQIASYLQYQVALLYHKLGNRDKAKQGFRRVVAKYTWNEELVKKANHFLDNLERTPVNKRVVLPGVETRTEYKGGYCVPNSLALVMRYWGSDVTARSIGKRITGLGSGTFVVNQQWFAEQEGFRHDFLPMAGLNDIKRCIDAGFPVLVYVPRHAFAIVGYDEALDTFVTYDIATNDVWVEYLQKDFIKAWKKQVTTLVLAYPPDKEALIPEDIRNRVLRLSDNYLHFQLHYFDAPTHSISVPHLLKAAGDTGEFFFPVTILYSDFPGLRETIATKYDPEFVSNSIKTYFWDDFDEGVHLWGQYHDERWAWPDWTLQYSMNYLIGQERFDLVEALITRIDEEGQVSEGMSAELGMINLAHGEFERGLDRLMLSERISNPLYVGLTYMKKGNIQGAIRALSKTLTELNQEPYYGIMAWQNNQEPCWRGASFGGSGRTLSLDNYGFPNIAIANRILIQENDYGESRENLEETWAQWLHHFPFDAPVAEALAKLYEQRLAKLDKEKNAAVYQRLERKLKLVRSRATRYNMTSFSQNSTHPLPLPGGE
jgi:tetratricopeptide (TPR) repeat protein